MNHLDLNKFKKCTCGVTVQDQCVDIKINYTLIGWFWLSMGTTAIPKEIFFTCNQCNKIFEHLSEKDIIKYYIFYRKH